MSAAVCNNWRVGKISGHYRVGHRCVPCRPLFVLLIQVPSPNVLSRVRLTSKLRHFTEPLTEHHSSLHCTIQCSLHCTAHWSVNVIFAEMCRNVQFSCDCPVSGSICGTPLIRPSQIHAQRVLNVWTKNKEPVVMVVMNKHEFEYIRCPLHE